MRQNRAFSARWLEAVLILLTLGLGVGMSLYLPLVEKDRYLGGFVLVSFLVLLAAVRLRPENQKPAGYAAMAGFCTMMLCYCRLQREVGHASLRDSGKWAEARPGAAK